MKPVAWVFDLDGTLVDTVETRIVAWLRTFEEYGIPANRGVDGVFVGQSLSPSGERGWYT